MAFLPEDKASRLRCFENALRNCDYEGYLVPKRLIVEWLTKELPEFSWRKIRRELRRHVESGGAIDEQLERRVEYAHYRSECYTSGHQR